MIKYFSDLTTAETSLERKDDSLYVVSKLDENSHNYIYSDFIAIHELDTDITSVSALGVVDNAKGISLAVIFFDGQKKKLGGKIVPFNQKSIIDIEEDSAYIKIGLRVQGRGVFTVYDILLSSDSDLALKSRDIFSFPILECCEKNEGFSSFSRISQPLITIETIFCDVERDIVKLDRYFSYLRVLFRLIEVQHYQNFYWMILISSDKAVYIQQLLGMLKDSNIKNKVFINIYEHPVSGYGNEGEANIDRLLKPNVTTPELREKHSSVFIDWITQQEKVSHDQVVVKLALDDDDFISPRHFAVIADSAISIDQKDRSSSTFVGIRYIGVVYHEYKGAQLDKVHFTKTMNGAKFLVSNGLGAGSPFAIPEDFPDNERYIHYNAPYPTFFYNRHAFNLSASGKSHFYQELVSSQSFESSEALLAHICSGVA